jgi:hypothetical protein
MAILGSYYQENRPKDYVSDLWESFPELDNSVERWGD